MTEDVFESELPPLFERSADQPAARLGDGEIGGKAAGLMSARRVLDVGLDRSRFEDIDIDVPRFTVLTTDVFDLFVNRNGLADIGESDQPDERIAHAFQRADFPSEYAGDLRAILDRTTVPVAVRSSSMLEDRLAHPFAGVYETKMIPNNLPDLDTRYLRLIEAIKYVYASMYFRGARTYLRSVGKSHHDEKMAVVLQEVVGSRHQTRYYPHVSGVARSFNYYAFGRARPENGVVDLALGLGKTIVDGGIAWSYCPAFPKTPPPFGSVRDQLTGTQTDFWAVNMGSPPAFNPISEVEFLEQHGLDAADYDGILHWIASTYDGASDRMLPGLREGGPRVINFAPILEYETFPLNDLVRAVLNACERALGANVEIEFALSFKTPTSPRTRFGFLQVRPMAGAGERVDLPEGPPNGCEVFLASDRVLGNGVDDQILDVVYVRPDVFKLSRSREAAGQLDQFNQRLLDAGRPYLLIGFGRWGSSDPWLGIPAQWSQISAARVIVEAGVSGVRVDPSQGSHFFHNLSSFGVSYFTVADAEGAIDWAWLAASETVTESELVRHVRLKNPMTVMVDGRSAKGVIFHQNRST